MAASLRTVVVLAVCLIVILLFCVQESDGRRGGYRSGGSGYRYRTSRSYRSYRSGARVRVRQRVRIRRGSSGFSSSTWKAAVLAGSIYGGAHYMRSSYYHRYPNRMPPICTNNYERAPNGRVYGYFICPRESEPANYTWCCGPSSREFCCDEYYYGRPSRSSGGVPAYVIVIILIVVIAIIVVIVVIYKRKKNQGVVLKKHSAHGQPKVMTEPHLTAPLTTHDDHPGDMKVDYTTAPNGVPGPGPYPANPSGPYTTGHYPQAGAPGAYPPPAGPYPPADGSYPPPAGYPPPNSGMPYPPGPMPGAVPPGVPPPYPDGGAGMQPAPPGFMHPPASAPPYPQ